MDSNDTHIESRIAVVNENDELASGAQHAPDFPESLLHIWYVMQESIGVDDVKAAVWKPQYLGIALAHVRLNVEIAEMLLGLHDILFSGVRSIPE